MNPTLKSGLIFLTIGIAMNLVGRVLLAFAREANNVSIAGFLALWMIVSLALAVFGLIKTIIGALRKPKNPV